MGFAGNYEPNFIVPSLISTVADVKKQSKQDIEDLNFFIGAEAVQKRDNYNNDYPIRHGVIENWDNIEKYWQRCIYQYLKCDPEEHMILLTEPPLNKPENREYTAEIWFETFNVPGLLIAVQAVLALCASTLVGAGGQATGSLTGTVIDSGDGVTHVIPVSDGYVIGSCIKHIPLAGSDITKFVLQMLRDRGEKPPSADAMDIAKRIKEMYCYVCPNLVKEYAKYDKDDMKNPSKFKKYEGIIQKTKKKYSIDVGYERFLGPEIFFSPEIFSADWKEDLPTVVDKCIQGCPIDTRRPLFNYITLSGGSTMFKHFVKRLERDIKRKVTKRYDAQVAALEARGMSYKPKKTAVNVITHDFQRFAVWFGGSMLASQPDAIRNFKTKAEYEEHGPRIVRSNAAF
jgi:actin-related protein 3